MSERSVLIVGGGIAGLCCARHLSASGVSCRILEADDRVGGRVRTDRVEGFLLDRGFQVLLTAYPEARRVLDFDALQLGKLKPGALIRYQGGFSQLVDPWRAPSKTLATLLSPVASLADKWRIARLRRRVCGGDLEALYGRPEVATLDLLRQEGFSARIIESFFRPFLGGVFLDASLETSSRLFEFVFRMFALGDVALPGDGIEAIPRQLAEALPEGTIRTGAEVEFANARRVRLAGGEEIEADAVVVATDGPAAARLLGDPPPKSARGVTCLYFAATQPPWHDPILMLNGEGRGPVNNLAVLSQTGPSYAPADRALISATVLGIADKTDEALQAEVCAQLRDWFGPQVDDWQSLRTYRIPYALPAQRPPALSPVQKPARREDGLFVCGDHRNTASLQGAMVSGRKAAEAVIEFLS